MNVLNDVIEPSGRLKPALGVVGVQALAQDTVLIPVLDVVVATVPSVVMASINVGPVVAIAVADPVGRKRAAWQ